MLYIDLPEAYKDRQLSFYLAMEEFVARQMDIDDCLLMWQVGPSVIFGRNQSVESEVNLAFCKAHQINVYRRKSGGGCVYADRGNIMLSLVTRADSVATSYNRYTTMLLWALQQMGISATANGRNDILIGGRKVSGNAFYHLGHSNIVHGTLLYDTTMSHMTGALTPPKEKLCSKGVESIRQHVTLLKEHTTMSIGQVKDSIRQLLCADTYRLTAEEEAEAEAIMQEYLSRDFICGHNPAYTVERRGSIEGVGNFDISITLRNNVIKAMALSGDFFAVGDIEKGIVEPLINTPLNRESLLSRLPESLGHIVMNLRRDDLTAILLTADPMAAHDESSLQKTENQQTR